jgi:hypothetical protein
MPFRAHEVDRRVKPGGGSHQVKSESMSTKSSTTFKKSCTLAGSHSASAGILPDNFSSNCANDNLPQPVPVGDWDQSDRIHDPNVADPALVEEWKNAWYNPPDVPKWETPALAQAKESTKASLPWDKIPWSQKPSPIRSVSTKLNDYTIGDVSIKHWEATMNQNQNKDNKNILVKERVHTKAILNMDYPLIDLSEE